MPARSALILSALLASSVNAAPTIDPQFGDHSVIQRGKPIRVSGSAAPGEPLTVSFGGKTVRATADSSGRWEAVFPALTRAGGSYAIKVEGSSNSSDAASDVTVGDVWLCSGQSNMEYPLRRALNGDGEVQSAADNDLRLMIVEKQLSNVPQPTFGKVAGWQRSTPETAKEFSAACFFMARDLRKTQKAPIGAIDDTWGGTPIRAWMDETSARASGNGAAADQLALYRSNEALALRQFGEQWAGWWRSRTGDAVGREPWNATARVTWKPMPRVGNWNDWGGDWPSFDGAVWARRRITLTAQEASQPATLSLGVIDDIDQTFVNGDPVGGSSDPVSARNYKLAPGVLHAGTNDIVVYVRDLWGPGGMMGPAASMQLTLAGDNSKPLSSGWEYARIADAVGSPPVPPWSNSSGVSTIYNAMVAPLGPLGLTGVAWYQGEADVGEPRYDRRLSAWMANWRTQFRDPKLPFLIVGLAGWGQVASRPVESGWASLINEQRLAVEHDQHAGFISAIDLGEPADIHPANKQEVGRRLALAARSLVYGDARGKLGPLPVGATRSGSVISLQFTKPLQTLSGASVNAMELCGTAAGSCRYANARVRGNVVQIAADSQPIARIRYAWADYPVVNLYDVDLLPVPVFELVVQ